MYFDSIYPNVYLFQSHFGFCHRTTRVGSLLLFQLLGPDTVIHFFQTLVEIPGLTHDGRSRSKLSSLRQPESTTLTYRDPRDTSSLMTSGLLSRPPDPSPNTDVLAYLTFHPLLYRRTSPLHQSSRT